MNKGRRLIIGDIHGCKRTFVKLLEKINFSLEDNLYILGDMINRGHNSSGVLNYIINQREAGFNITTLRGNHEQMLLDVVEKEPEKIHSYLRNYKSVDLLGLNGNIKTKYLDLIKQSPYYIELDNYILVHAALDLSTYDIFENKEFMLFSRYQRGSTTRLNGKQLIHGHIATDIQVIKKSIIEKFAIIPIDNGCIYTRERKGFGKLLCLNLENMEITTKSYCEKS